VALTLAAFGFLALAIWLFISPPFRWQTAFVTLAVKDYHLGTVTPVPFFEEDMAALTTSLSPALNSRMGTKPVALSGMESVESLRSLLAGRIGSLPLRHKDVLVAYVRGQSIVVPPLLSPEGKTLSDDDRLAGRACMLAADFRVQGDRPKELIGWREVVEALGSGWYSPTLVAIDFGDLEWDPRLGVLANVVAKQLDVDFSHAQVSAVGANWIIGSHDLFGASMASVTARRTLFARALELGLSGASDAKPWGNENGIVELDELANFMTCQIANWSFKLTDGRSQQRPVVWKLGVGRVPIADIPKGIALIRVVRGRRPAEGPIWALGWGARTGEDKATPAKPASDAETPDTQVRSDSTRQRSGGESPSGETAMKSASGTVSTASPPPGGAGTRPPAAPAATPPSADAEPSAAEAVAAAPPPPSPQVVAGPLPIDPTQSESAATSASQGVWSQLDRLSTRRTAVHARESRLLPLDYAPHVWARLAKTASEAEVRLRVAEGLFEDQGTPRVAGKRPPAAGESQRDADGRRMRAFLDDIDRQLALIPSSSSDISPRIIETTPADSVIVHDLKIARNAAENRGMFRQWALTPPMLQNAIAIRNDAVATTFEAVDFIGKCSAGAGAPLLIDPLICRAVAEQAQEVSRLLAELNGLPAGSDDPRSVRLRAATRACEAQTAWLQELVVRSVLPVGKRSLRYLPDDTIDSSLSFRRWRAAQLSLLFSEAQRSQLRPTAFPRPVTIEQATAATEAATPAGVGGVALEPVGFDRPPIDLPVRVDSRSLSNIAQLIQSLATAADAAGIDVSSKDPPKEIVAVIREIAALRTEAAALVSMAGDDAAALGGVVRLGGRAARALHAVAVAVVQADPGAGGRVGGSDQISSLLRIVDYRDVVSLPRNLLVTLPLSTAQAQSELAFQTPEGVQLSRGDELRAVIEISRLGGMPSLDRILRLSFDPAILQVRSANGVLLQPDAPLDLQHIAMQGTSLELRLLATGARPTTGTGETAQLVALWERGQSSQRAVLDLKLPDRRDIVLAARRTPAATSRSKVGLRQLAITTGDGWEFSTPMRSGGSGDPVVVSRLVLSAMPGRITAWELGLFNAASVQRDVSLEIYSLPETSDPSRRESAWREFAAALLNGTWQGEPIATIPKLSLAHSADVVSVDIPPATAAPQAPAAAPASQAAGSSKDKLIGPDLAVIVRESTLGQPPETWLTRLILSPEHPRSWVDAHATWNPGDRTIVVTVAPVKNPGTEPVSEFAGAENVRLSLEALKWGPAPPRQPLLIRKGAATLGPGRSSDTMVATWNGGAQDGRAWLHVGVDGYPRAFVFAVDCSSAAAGEIQRPQFDWRCVNILRPEERQLVLKAPVADLPMTLAVDVPADASGDGLAAASAISLTMREVNASIVVPGISHPVWKTSADRQALFTREKAVGRATFAVKTVVQDWEVNAAGLGFKDVDVVAEVSVIVPGAQTPLVERRRFTMDARPPVVEVPPMMNVVIGRPLVVPVRVTDDPRESPARAPDSHLAGVSGVARVEWGLDLKGDGTPAAWQPAVGLGGDMYEIRLDTSKLPPGVRLPLFVRATDRVGLSNTPEPVWLDASPAPAKNGIRGKVVLNGRGEDGVVVSLTGPGAPMTMTSGTNGVFQFPDLDPGDYTLQASGAVRNRTYSAPEAKVSVAAPPAPEVNVTLQLK